MSFLHSRSSTVDRCSSERRDRNGCFGRFDVSLVHRGAGRWERARHGYGSHRYRWCARIDGGRRNRTSSCHRWRRERQGWDHSSSGATRSCRSGIHECRIGWRDVWYAARISRLYGLFASDTHNMWLQRIRFNMSARRCGRHAQICCRGWHRSVGVSRLSASRGAEIRHRRQG